MGPQWRSVVEVGAAFFNLGLATKLKRIGNSFQTQHYRKRKTIHHEKCICNLPMKEW